MRRCGALTLVLLAGCDPSPGADACYGVCGEGTVCDAKQCVVQAIEEPQPEPEPESARKGKKKRRRRGHAKSKSASTPGFTPDDDSAVPQFDPKATKVLDLKAGTERLGDRVVNSHLRGLEPKFNKCIEKSALAYEGTISGSLDFVISIQASGKVGGVTVKGSKSLRESGVVPCARKVVHSHRFPSFDGTTMGVDYSFKVG